MSLPIAYSSVLFLAAMFAFTQGSDRWGKDKLFAVIYFAHGGVAFFAWIISVIDIFWGIPA